MNGWIIYNGALRMDKIEKLVTKLSLKAKAKGINLQLIKNNELLPFLNQNGQADLNATIELTKPEFIIFWDKDIYLARHLEAMGFKLFNSREAIEVCDDKALMHLSLSKSGIRVPKTIVGPFVFHQQKLNDAYIDSVLKICGEKLVIKESHGSFGMQVYQTNGREALVQQLANLGSNGFVIQENIASSCGRDIRVNIVGDEIVGAMERVSTSDFRANITLGGQGRIIDLNSKQREMALGAHRALKLDFSGVDILFGENDEPVLCEVNSNVNYLSFEDVTGIDFSDKLIQYIVGAL